MNWYIGQEIVCVEFHKEGFVKEGNIYKINDIRKGCCSNADIDVGKKDPKDANTYGTNCRYCNKTMNNGSNNTIWFDESRFAPLQDMTEQISELLEQKIKI